MKIKEIKKNNWYNFLWMGGQKIYKVVEISDEYGLVLEPLISRRKVLLSYERFKEIEVEELAPNFQIKEVRHEPNPNKN